MVPFRATGTSLKIGNFVISNNAIQGYRASKAYCTLNKPNLFNVSNRFDVATLQQRFESNFSLSFQSLLNVRPNTKHTNTTNTKQPFRPFINKLTIQYRYSKVVIETDSE